MQEMVTMSLYRFSSGDGLQSIRNLYGVHKSALSKVIMESCRDVRKHLQPIFMQTPSASQFRILA